MWVGEIFLQKGNVKDISLYIWLCAYFKFTERRDLAEHHKECLLVKLAH